MRIKVGDTVWWVNGNAIASGRVILARPSEIEDPRQVVLDVGGDLVLMQHYELNRLHPTPEAAVAAEVRNITQCVTTAMGRTRELDAALVKVQAGRVPESEK